MSLRRESVENARQSVFDVLESYYHIPVLAVLMAAMVTIRLKTYDSFIRGGEVFFSGNDAWYHLRAVNYTVRHWPFTIAYDPWTYFPYGTRIGQFGTLYDQLIATAALLVGLGSPSEMLVGKVLLVAPPVFAALTLIPVYYLGKRFGGRLAGLFGAAVLALLPGTFLQRTLVGAADHNAAEPFFQATAVAALVVAFAVAEREQPIWELVADRDVDELRTATTYAALAGVATALYMWVWPPGVLLVGIVGIFLVLKTVGGVVGGRSPEPAVYAGAVSMGVTAVLMLIPLQTFSFTVTNFSLVQPLFAFIVAVGAVFLAWLARQWEARAAPDEVYPAAVLGLLLLGVGLTYVLLPPLYQTIRSNFLSTVGFNIGAQTGTISEAQPYLSPDILRQRGFVTQNGNPDRVAQLLYDYGFTLFTAVCAAALLLVRPLVERGSVRRTAYAVASLVVVGLLFLVPALPAAIGSALGINSSLVSFFVVTALIAGATLLYDYPSETLLIVVWAAIITSAAFTQVRFNYYLAVVVAVLNAALLAQVLDVLDLRDARESLSNVEGHQVLVVVAVVLLVLTPGLIVPLQSQSRLYPQSDGGLKSPPAAQLSEYSGPDAVEWDGTLEWMQRQTPEEGTFGGADNQMDYYRSYEPRQDFQYPEGAYGVMSWWDYGHWITVEGNRIPNANPFQQGATAAANFLLAPNESQAQDVLTRMSTEGNRTRYVMVDWQMASPGAKFGAPVVFYDEANVSQRDFYDRVYGSQRRTSFLVRDQRYYDSLMVRLYEYHGSSFQPQPVVVDWRETTLSTSQGQVTIKEAPAGQNNSIVKQFRNMSAARNYVQQDGSSQVGGIGPYPQERVPALQHYRLVKASNSSAYESRSYQRSVFSTYQATGVQPRFLTHTTPSWVKTFERVPGATIRGSGAPANTTVRASVQMRVPTTNSTFTYSQQTTTNANGEFSMTVPYSTTGYAQYGPQNGYTNVSVRATGPYTLETPAQIGENQTSVIRYVANASVSEGQVVGATEGPTQVTLERRTTPLVSPDNQSTGNESAQSAGNESGGNQSTSSSFTVSGNESSGGGNGSNSAALDAPAAADAEGVNARSAEFASAAAV